MHPASNTKSQFSDNDDDDDTGVLGRGVLVSPEVRDKKFSTPTTKEQELESENEVWKSNNYNGAYNISDILVHGRILFLLAGKSDASVLLVVDMQTDALLHAIQVKRPLRSVQFGGSTFAGEW